MVLIDLLSLVGTIRAIVKGVREKDITIQVAQYCAEELRQRGLKVCMTRNDDRFLTLEERGRLCISTCPDIFVSIHANSAPNASANGIEVFTVPVTFTERPEQRPCPG